jgi:hypothetical protein
MEFDLGVADRITLLGILPPEEVQTNFLTLKGLRVFREELALIPEEAEEIDLKDLGDGRIQWNMKKEKPKTFSIDDGVLGVIQRRLKTLDTAGKLLDQHMLIYEKFIAEDTDR